MARTLRFDLESFPLLGVDSGSGCFNPYHYSKVKFANYLSWSTQCENDLKEAVNKNRLLVKLLKRSNNYVN